ncbi:MAG: transporter [Porphyromonadaceae bacterium CG2_30_38_12]|nr:MAG: transporter [Porphyromonadaceae bacterium CG2_30_38_12]
MIKKLKAYMMPIAISVGILLHSYVGALVFLIPYLIFAMLLLTYIKLSVSKLRITAMHWWLLAIQVLGSSLLYFILQPLNIVLAQSVMICVLAPTASAAPVIGGMLKGNVASLTTYGLMSNLAVAFFAPLLFSFIGYRELAFFDSAFDIAQKVIVLLALPLLLSVVINRWFKTLAKPMQQHTGITFYMWSLALTIVTGRTVQFVIEQGKSQLWLEIVMAVAALVVCVMQFWIGRRIGRKLDDTVAGGQGLGQKNTILVIWMAQMYLNPLAAIGPGAYVLWQNSVNSWQLWRIRKHL